MFASMLRRDKEGHFWLKTPREEGVIQVEDAPFIAVELNFEGSCGRHQTLSLRTNIDEIISVNALHPLIMQWRQIVTLDAAPVPYLQVRPGDGDFPILARLTRAVYFELAALAVSGQVGCEKCMGVWSDNCFFPPCTPPWLKVLNVSGAAYLLRRGAEKTLAAPAAGAPCRWVRTDLLMNLPVHDVDLATPRRLRS